MTDDNSQAFGKAPDYEDLLGEAAEDRTSTHYADQWGSEKGYVDFIRAAPSALRHTTGVQLGWPELFERIRDAAAEGPVKVYDAACGFGGLLDQIGRAPSPPGLHYLGADIRDGLAELKIPEPMRGRARFVRWDISRPLPFGDRFDFVICRAAIHHTPDPRATFRSLCAALAPGGTIAISAYARKGLLREAMDDALRARITAMDTGAAFQAIKDLTRLGRDLQAVQERVEITEDLDFLGIPAGRYPVHDLVYRFMLKCWYNSEFGERHSHIVNYDWYHAPFAHRYDLDDLRCWFQNEELSITRTQSIPAQHYLEGSKAR